MGCLLFLLCLCRLQGLTGVGLESREIQVLIMLISLFLQGLPPEGFLRMLQVSETNCSSRWVVGSICVFLYAFVMAGEVVYVALTIPVSFCRASKRTLQDFW